MSRTASKYSTGLTDVVELSVKNKARPNKGLATYTLMEAQESEENVGNSAKVNLVTRNDQSKMLPKSSA